MNISFHEGSFPYIKIEVEKIFPAAILNAHIDKIKNKKESKISIVETLVRTNLTDNTGDEVRGKRDNIFIVNESGLPRAMNAIAIGMHGIIINEPLAEVFGSFMVEAIAEKKVFQKKKPPKERKNKTATNNGLVITSGIDQPLPKNEDMITNTTVLNE